MFFCTYPRECNATVATLRGSGEFSDVVVDELSSRCLHDTPSVGGGVVWLAFAERNTLGHCALDDGISEITLNALQRCQGILTFSGVSWARTWLGVVGWERSWETLRVYCTVDGKGRRTWTRISTWSPALNLRSLVHRTHVTLQVRGWQGTRTKNGFSTWFERVQILEYQSLPARPHPLSSHPHPQLIWRLPR